MKIALIADVHGNLPALEAVLRHAHDKGVDECWNLGDMVGYGPFPDECVALLRQSCRQHVAGNYDRKVLSKKKLEKMRERAKDRDKLFSLEWTMGHLSDSSLDFIRSLPSVQPVESDGRRVLLVHGSPESDDDGLSPSTPAARLEELSRLTDAELVLCGHTHIFFDRLAAGVRFVNPGGTGRSFDGDARASYCLVDIAKEIVTVEHFRLDYDVDGLAQAMQDRGFSERLVRSLREGRGLDEVDDTAGSTGAQEVVARALEVGIRHKFDQGHALQVTALALKIFDGLNDEHGLTSRERLYLQCGGLLHDVAFAQSPDKHHKASRDVVLEAAELPLSRRERIVVGLLARYHRGSLPEKSHRYYGSLSARDRDIVDKLAGILRVADGLDRSHRARVRDVSVGVKEGTIALLLEADDNVSDEERSALLKGDLLQKVFRKILVVRKR